MKKVKPYDLINVTDEDFGEKFYELIKSDSDAFIQKYIPKTFLFRYLLNYLKFEKNGLQIKTIIRENDYTCLNFLEDYANYYARCYTLYEKHCKRLHFFQETFTENVFLQMLRDPGHEIWEKYAGCMVIKPLPKGIFGITHLNTYEPKDERHKDERHYVCLSEKTINLFGHDCKIKTMPFKEQDGKVASCATTALWMAFQKTSELFNTKAPSLSEVTILAGDDNSNSGKIFPSKGLEINQVCKAIYKNGLMSEFRTDLTSLRFFKGLVYAYLKGDIPVLLGLRLPTDDECHLVTVNGYRLSPENRTMYASDKIIRFYAHDDQIGPFARLLINDNGCTVTNDKGQEIGYDYSLTTSWCKKEKQLEWQNNVFIKTSDSNNKENPDSFVQSTPECVIIPISPVIKVTYEDIFEQQSIVDYVLKSFIDIENELTWDIYINKSNDYKKWLLKEGIIGKEDSQRIDILTTSLPQYIWIVQAWIEGALLFDFIYDTVELNMTGQPVAINVYNNDFWELLKDEEMIDVRCSNGFFREKYKDSLMKRMNELPNELKEWFKSIKSENIELEHIKSLISESILESILEILSEGPKEKLVSDYLVQMLDDSDPDDSDPDDSDSDSEIKV